MDEEASEGTFSVTTLIAGPINLNLAADMDMIQLAGLTLLGLEAALIQGLGWALALFLFGFWSGDYNPTYSLVVGFLPKTNVSFGVSLLNALVKIVAQHVGAIVGAALVLAVVGSGAFPDAPVPTISDFPNALLMEFLGAVWIGWLILTLQFNPRTSSLANPALAIATTVTLLVLFSAPLTGGVFNWAHYFGRAVFAGFNSKWWIYLLGPLAGHAVAAFLYVTVSRVEL
jgi:glycerol uptake facilitator-like aquaporin